MHTQFLKLTGRIKEQFKIENGKYIVPAPLEVRNGKKEKKREKKERRREEKRRKEKRREEKRRDEK